MTQEHAGQSFSDYARLSPDLVIDAIEHTGRLSDARVFALNSYENRVYQVGIEDELPLVAKFYRPGRWSDAQIREEHSFTRELAAAELPVIAPIANDDGETLFGYGDYRFALFLRKGGQGLEAGDLDQLHRVGMLLGRVHQIGRQQAFSHRPVLDIERYLTQPVCRVEARLPAHLLAAYRTVITQLQVLIQASGLGQLRHVRTQGDTHPGNILWTRDDGPWLLDFDDCQSAPAVQDLWMLLSGSRPEQELQLAELLDGYQMFCDFDARELASIEALRSLRMIHYAGWLALRWEDPAFPAAFPWFDTPHYWQTHIGELQMQIERMGEPPLRML
jgi:Ser/Thr protein kinase RdoA (MazF antagonist)